MNIDVHILSFSFPILNSKKGFDVRSFGTGSVVKLPGPGPEQPNVYEFGTTYQFMYEDLYRKDPHLYLSAACSSVASASCSLAKAVALSAFSFVLCDSSVVQWIFNVLADTVRVLMPGSVRAWERG